MARAAACTATCSVTPFCGAVAFAAATAQADGMKYRLRTLLILLATASPLIGCRQSSLPPSPPNPAAATPSSEPPANYSFDVRGESGSIQKSVSGNVDLTIGNAHLQVQDGALTVNGKPHGRIKDGDAVLVQADGQVLVNLQVRRPL